MERLLWAPLEASADALRRDGATAMFVAIDGRRAGIVAGIARARALSRATMRNIRQNLVLAFVNNLLGIPHTLTRPWRRNPREPT